MVKKCIQNAFSIKKTRTLKKGASKTHSLFNLKSGKNLVGRIYQPKAVEIDTNFLLTLPDRQINAALAEAIKYGFIYDRELFDFIASSVDNIIENNINVPTEERQNGGFRSTLIVQVLVLGTGNTW